MANNDTEALLKSYEPMMHKLLKKYNIKRDYNDLLQELRLKTLEAVKEFEKSTNKKKQDTKIQTYVHRCLENRIRNMLRMDYGIVLDKSRKVKQSKEFDIEKLSPEERRKYSIHNPDFYEDFPYDFRASILNSYEIPEEIRINCDLKFFKDILTPLDRKIVELREKGLNQNEISKELRIPQTKVSRKLIRLKEAFKSFINITRRGLK